MSRTDRAIRLQLLSVLPFYKIKNNIRFSFHSLTHDGMTENIYPGIPNSTEPEIRNYTVHTVDLLYYTMFT